MQVVQETLEIGPVISQSEQVENSEKKRIFVSREEVIDYTSINQQIGIKDGIFNGSPHRLFIQFFTIAFSFVSELQLLFCCIRNFFVSNSFTISPRLLLKADCDMSTKENKKKV